MTPNVDQHGRSLTLPQDLDALEAWLGALAAP